MLNTSSLRCKRAIFAVVLILFTQVGIANQPELAKAEVAVFAVEYPPFTTMETADRGINFQLLAKTIGHKFTISPSFVPPARAGEILRHEPWCISFYPPKGMDDTVRFFPLSEQRVELAFYRTASNAPTISNLDTLAGQRVAVLRVKKLGTFHQPLLDAGAELVMTESVAQGLELLKFGRVDHILADEVGVSEALNKLDNMPVMERSEYVYFETHVGAHLNTQCKHYNDLVALFGNIQSQ